LLEYSGLLDFWESFRRIRAFEDRGAEAWAVDVESVS